MDVLAGLLRTGRGLGTVPGWLAWGLVAGRRLLAAVAVGLVLNWGLSRHVVCSALQGRVLHLALEL